MYEYEYEVREMEQSFRAGPRPATTRPIVFYGSSSIRLWSSLASDLGDSRVVNLGFGGSTMAACAHFFERLVVPRRPDSLIVYVGDNDLGIGRSVAEVYDSFQGLIRQVDSHLGPILFAFLSIKPSPALWPLVDEIREANRMIREELHSRSHSIYIDIFEPMLGPDGRPRRELYQEDGLHLTRKGYLVWLDRILSHRVAIFGEADNSTGEFCTS